MLALGIDDFIQKRKNSPLCTLKLFLFKTKGIRHMIGFQNLYIFFGYFASTYRVIVSFEWNESL